MSDDDEYHAAEIARRQAELEAMKIATRERGNAINNLSYVFLGAGLICLLLLFSLAFGPKP